MIVILGLDGLEYEYVKEFNCKHLMQASFGKTDISEFTEPRTIVIWSSFLAGKNLEEKILSLGKEDLWMFRVKPEETFFSSFKTWRAIDVPGFTHKYENHKRERELLKAFFKERTTVGEYDKVAFENYKENKEEFFEVLEDDYEIIMGYFALADTIGHLSFGLKNKMKIVYKELDNLVRKTEDNVDGKILIISDHGMKAIGRFGDHSSYGFWSTSCGTKLENPKITEFRKIIWSLANR